MAAKAPEAPALPTTCPLKPADLEPTKRRIREACFAQGRGKTQQSGAWVGIHAGTHTGSMSPPPSGILSLQLQGEGDEGLCGLEKYHLTHRLDWSWAL